MNGLIGEYINKLKALKNDTSNEYDLIRIIQLIKLISNNNNNNNILDIYFEIFNDIMRYMSYENISEIFMKDIINNLSDILLTECIKYITEDMKYLCSEEVEDIEYNNKIVRMMTILCKQNRLPKNSHQYIKELCNLKDLEELKNLGPLQKIVIEN